MILHDWYIVSPKKRRQKRGRGRFVGWAVWKVTASRASKVLDNKADAVSYAKDRMKGNERIAGVVIASGTGRPHKVLVNPEFDPSVRTREMPKPPWGDLRYWVD